MPSSEPHGKTTLSLDIAQPIPPAGSVFPAQTAMNRAFAALVAGIRALLDQFSQGFHVGRTHPKPRVVKGLIAHCPSPGLFVNRDPGKATVRALDDLEGNLIRAAVRRQFDPDAYSQGFGG
jgi:small basic protein